MTVQWFNSNVPETKFAPNLKMPLYTTIAYDSTVIEKLREQILQFEYQISQEPLVSEVPKRESDPYAYTQHWKQHNLFWDINAKDGEQLARFSMSVELEKLFHTFRKHYLIFLKELNYPRPKVYIHAWANVLRKGEWISEHSHMSDATAYLSSAYYLTTNPTFLHLKNCTRPDQTESFATREGRLILFPSWIPHESDVYNGDDLRISIAFDISIERNKLSNPFRPHTLFDDPNTMEGLEMYLKDRSLTF